MNNPSVIAELARSTAPAGAALVDLQDDLEQLENRLRALSGPDSLATLCADLFSAGGKRMRAVATVVVGRAFDLPQPDVLRIAEAIELTHGATLLHDDVIDEADLRRGQPTARLQWSNIMSILGGDSLLVRALHAIAELNSHPLLIAHLRTLDLLVAAEAEQHLARLSGDLSIDGYLQIARGKTGSLLAFACSGPAVLAGQSEAADCLEIFGNEVGIAFQVADDLRDILSQDATKTMLLDLRGGVLTLPIRMAAARDEGIKAMLEQSAGHLQDTNRVAELVQRVRGTGAVAQSMALAREHLTRGRASLRRIGDELRLEQLEVFCDWLTDELNHSDGER